MFVPTRHKAKGQGKRGPDGEGKIEDKLAARYFFRFLFLFLAMVVLHNLFSLINNFPVSAISRHV